MSGPGRPGFDLFPLHRTLGITAEDVRPGYARIAMKTSSLTLGGVSGSVHGGLLALLVDVAMLEALIPMLQGNEQAAGTADLNITYLRPATGDRVVAEATVLRKGRQLAVSEVAIFNGEGTLCAKGRTIYALRPNGASGGR
ncbi:MAG TPA: PaaI family thioesterase [Gemmatimonadales bacterium]|nr:PaaI family thioesterase [Gemmatimonadales bacterium]